MMSLSAERYQERVVDAQAIQALGLPPDALAEGCHLTVASDFDWILFYPAHQLAIWSGPDGLTSFPADSLADALRRVLANDF